MSLRPAPDGELMAPTLQIEGQRAAITLRRIGQHNRIDPDDVPVIMAHLDAVLQAKARVLVITGTGRKTFCAGYTIGAIRSRLDSSFEEMLDRIETLPLPTICALNGSAYGGGTDLALCCDFRIGVVGSRMRMPAAAFGLHYYPGGLRRFVARLGPGAAKRIFLTGQSLEAEEMLRIGFLTELVAPDELGDRVDAYVEDILKGGADVQASMKRHIDQLCDGSWSEAQGKQAYLRSLQSEELAARLAQLTK